MAPGLSLIVFRVFVKSGRYKFRMFKPGWLVQKREVRSSLSTAQRVRLVLELPKSSGKRTSDTGWHTHRRATLLSIEFCYISSQNAEDALLRLTGTNVRNDICQSRSRSSVCEDPVD